MPNEFQSAMGELQQCFDLELGQPQTVQIKGKKYPAIIEDVEFDTIVAAGGDGESGGFRCSINKADHPKEPEQGTEIIARGMKVDILTVANINDATWSIIAGDPAIE